MDNSATAFIVVRGNATDIPLPGQWAGLSATAINDSNQVAGDGETYVSTPPGSLLAATQAFIYTADSGVTPIPLPPGATVAVAGSYSINDSGTVVGYSDAGAWIWTLAGGTQLLNTFVPTGWDIGSALSISNNGLILAQGSYDGGPVDYVELSTAAPEPGSAIPGLAGLLLLAWRRLRAFPVGGF